MIDSRIDKLLKGKEALVDLGCGSGEILDSMKGRYRTRIGLDISDKRLKQLHDRPGTGWKFQHTDLNEPFPLPTNFADTVLANQVIEHIKDPCFFAMETFRILKPGGMAVVTTPNIRYIKHIWRLVGLGRGPSTGGRAVLDGAWDNGHIHYFTHRDLREAFDGAGFSYIQSQAFIDLAHNNLLRSALAKCSRSKLVRELLSGNILLVAKK